MKKANVVNLIFTLGNVIIYDVVNNWFCFLYLCTVFSSKQLDGAQMLANNNTPIILPSALHMSPGSSFFVHISLPGTSTITVPFSITTCKGQSLKPTVKDYSNSVEAASKYLPKDQSLLFFWRFFISMSVGFGQVLKCFSEPRLAFINKFEDICS